MRASENENDGRVWNECLCLSKSGEKDGGACDEGEEAGRGDEERRAVASGRLGRVARASRRGGSVAGHAGGRSRRRGLTSRHRGGGRGGGLRATTLATLYIEGSKARRLRTAAQSSVEA